MKAFSSVLLFLITVLSLSVQAGIEVRQFPDSRLEQRYYRLISELRCLVCQNQSLADSNADLAEDLRDEVFTMLLAGKTDQEIVAFLVDRYGDFVLYRPPVKKITIALWLGPFVALLLGGFVLWRISRARSLEVTTPLTDEERQRLKKLLQQDQGETGQ